MTIYNFKAGEAVYWIPARGARPRRVIRFRPQGRIEHHLGPRRTAEEVMSRTGSGLTGRVLVGLAGKNTTWSPRDVVDVIVKTRQARGDGAGASIVSQLAICQKGGALVEEPAVQAFIIDLAHTAKEAFAQEMIDVAEALRHDLEREEVILEIQVRGVVEDTYAIVP